MMKKTKARKPRSLGTVKRAATSKKSDNTVLLVLGGIAAGTALVLMQKGKASPSPLPQNTIMPVTTPKPVTTTPKPATTTTPVTTQPVQPVPAPANQEIFDNTVKNHVFVDSWPEGESVYGKAVNATFKANSDFIVIVLHNRYLGKLTGKEASDIISTYVEVGSFIDGKFRTYWVNKKAVKFVTDAERDKLLKGGGGYLISDSQLAAFRKYFIGK